MRVEPKLTVEIVPESCHFKNVRSEVSKEQWDKLRKQTYRAANYRCEICGGKGDKWPVECHEVRDYNEETKMQKLVRLIVLCPACHEVKHLDLASLNGRFEEAVSHLRTINN
jgi:5-methylcytosine-specific restriction endonuclease McrA